MNRQKIRKEERLKIKKEFYSMVEDKLGEEWDYEYATFLCQAVNKVIPDNIYKKNYENVEQGVNTYRVANNKRTN